MFLSSTIESVNSKFVLIVFQQFNIKLFWQFTHEEYNISFGKSAELDTIFQALLWYLIMKAME